MNVFPESRIPATLRQRPGIAGTGISRPRYTVKERISNMRELENEIPEELDSLPKSARGAYILEFRIKKALLLRVGKFGEFRLNPGWYYYVGSAMGGLRGRLLRHVMGPEKPYWHIDYLTENFGPERIWIFISAKKIEDALAQEAAKIAESAIPRFGCGDSPDAETHLFYSESRLEFSDMNREIGNAEVIVVNLANRATRK